MRVNAKIQGIKYKIYCAPDLNEVTFNEFDINSTPSCFSLSDKKYNYGISKWVSPKRTRSYPYERIYNTLNMPKRITVIPIIKDEGVKGDRDYIQWDTVSLMSLLDVYVIFAYYNDASINPRKQNKITNQKFDNTYIKNKIIEISNYHSSALHWNLKETQDTLPSIIELVQENYNRLSKKLNIPFHNPKGIEIFKEQFQKDITDFMNTSRKKANEAQNRELLTHQPKEFLSTSSKATITIENYLGGKYYFTADEISTLNNKLQLIEGKHSTNYKLPGRGDIKDGLLKMILYSNLNNVKINDINFIPQPLLKLTSNKISGQISSHSSISEIEKFKSFAGLNKKNIEFIDKLFLEANDNNFEIIIQGV
ncbi:MAG TPA: hypothetical protein PLC04_05955 [Candidatus Kapabacteria bacterium]|nr:hypothetical protein [Candidatus Kapabacteria bacterium]HOV92602.1 hypothetical protein [Candidatus Kapabacteria bacterium]